MFLNAKVKQAVDELGFHFTRDGIATVCPACKAHDNTCVICMGAGYIDEARMTTLAQVLGAEIRPESEAPTCTRRVWLARKIMRVCAFLMFRRKDMRQLFLAEFDGIVDAYAAVSKYNNNG